MHAYNKRFNMLLCLQELINKNPLFFYTIQNLIIISYQDKPSIHTLNAQKTCYVAVCSLHIGYHVERESFGVWLHINRRHQVVSVK